MISAAAPSVEELSSLWDDIRRALEQETGMNLSDERQSRLVDAFHNFVRSNGLTTLSAIRGEFTEPLKRPAALERLVSHLTVGETYFFRNPDHFRSLKETVLPAILQDNRRARTIRIWSSGCATGEEPYSIAILLDRDFPASVDWDLRILGTDISKDFLNRARSARYRNWSFRQTDVSSDPRYFKHEKDEYLLTERIQKMVRFHHLNLVYDAYPSPITQTAGLDLILFRNVAIYLRDEVSQNIIRRFAWCLRPGGWLIIGEVEISHRLYSSDEFEKVQDGETVLLRRRGGPVAIPLTDILPIVPIWEQRLPEILRDADPAAWPGDVPAPIFPVSVSEARPTALKLRHAIDQGELDEAQKLLSEAADPKLRASLALDLARARLIRGQVQQAEHLLEQAVESEPLLLEAQLLRASLSEEAGDLPKAEEALRRALYIDRDCLMAHLLLGVILRRAQNPEADRIFRNALLIARRLDPNDAVPFGDGMCAGRYAQIVEQMA